MYVSTNGTTSAIPIPIKNDPQLPGKIDRNPGIPPTPMDDARTPAIVITIPAIAEPIIAKINGYRKRKFTPNIAGSVIPR